MVEQMEKVTLVFLNSMKQSILSSLQNLGVVHIENRKANATAEMNALEQQIEKITEARDFLSEFTSADKGSLSSGAVNPPQDESETGEQDLIEKIADSKKRLTESEKRIEETERQLQEAQRWGSFNPAALMHLSERGYILEVYSAPVKTAEEIKKDLEESPSVSFDSLFEEKGNLYFAVVYREEEGHPGFDAKKVQLPDVGTAELEESLENARAEKAEAEKKITELVVSFPVLERRLRERRNELAFRSAEVSGSDAAEGKVTILTGWVPVDNHQGLVDFLENTETVYYISAPELDENVPVKLRQSGFTNLFQPILKIFSLPDYHEVDPTPFFAPFYMIFFGLCVADMGYGLLLLVGAFAALIVLKRKAAKQLIYLGIVLALSVLVFGIFLNDFFGIKLTEITKSGSAFRQIILFKDPNGAMLLAIMLGVIQVLFGYVLKVINRVRVHGFMGAMKPVGVILMLLGIFILVLRSLGKGFSIGPFPLGAAAALIPHGQIVGYTAAGLGLALIIFLGSVEHKPLLRPLFGFWELYEIATGIPGDILSYLRLYALGLSGGLLAEAILHIAVLARGNSPAGIIPMAIILLLGTGLNLAIGLLSAFVHSLRLTFVEFYKAVGFKGGGVEYTPFQIK